MGTTLFGICFTAINRLNNTICCSRKIALLLWKNSQLIIFLERRMVKPVISEIFAETRRVQVINILHFSFLILFWQVHRSRPRPWGVMARIPGKTKTNKYTFSFYIYKPVLLWTNFLFISGRNAVWGVQDSSRIQPKNQDKPQESVKR